MTTETRPAGYHRAALVNALDGGMCDDCDSACPRCEKARTLVDRHAAEVRAAAQAELEDQRAARRTAAESADRFRDIVADCLGHADENPGDDTLIAELRAHFGRTGPEPTGWRDRLAGYEAARDQINAAARPDNTTGA